MKTKDMARYFCRFIRHFAGSLSASANDHRLDAVYRRGFGGVSGGRQRRRGWDDSGDGRMVGADCAKGRDSCRINGDADERHQFAGALTGQGNSTAEGFLTISPNEQYISLTGYDVAPGSATPSTAASTADNRTVGIVNVSNGHLDTSTVLSDASSGSSFRSAITTDGTNIWALGGARVEFATQRLGRQPRWR